MQNVETQTQNPVINTSIDRQIINITTTFFFFLSTTVILYIFLDK